MNHSRGMDPYGYLKRWLSAVMPGPSSRSLAANEIAESQPLWGESPCLWVYTHICSFSCRDANHEQWISPKYGGAPIFR
jgi:hypothetical protein